MKRLLSLLLSLVIVVSLLSPALAASDEATAAADALYELGLFGGTGTDANGNPIFDLDRAPTRHEAVTMLVRLLGKTNEAENGTWSIPFTDVAEWAKPYVGYAYTNGLVGGTSATTFSGNENVTAAQYITLVLRALGYESGTDFQWNTAWELSDKIGLTDGRYNADTANFTRGDVAIISYYALNIQNKAGTATLQEMLVSAPVITVSNNIPDSQKSLLLNAYAEKMYFVTLNSIYLQLTKNAIKAQSTDDVIYYVTMVQQVASDECVTLEKMKNICGNYDDTKILRESIEENIRLRSMGPKVDNSFNNAREYISLLGSENYSAAYRANVDLMQGEIYKLFPKDMVNDAVNQYVEEKIAEIN